MNDENFRQTEPAGIRQRLQELRNALLHLHKALIESERVSYEKAVGPIQSPHHFFQLLTNDPWFVWLSPLSKLIVLMDEALDAKEPMAVAGVDALVEQVNQLLVASEAGHGFSTHYDNALQRDPDVVFAAAELAKHRGSRS